MPKGMGYMGRRAPAPEMVPAHSMGKTATKQARKPRRTPRNVPGIKRGGIPKAKVQRSSTPKPGPAFRPGQTKF